MIIAKIKLIWVGGSLDLLTLHLSQPPTEVEIGALGIELAAVVVIVALLCLNRNEKDYFSIV